MAAGNTVKKYLGRYSFTLGFLLLFFAWMWLRPDSAPQVYQLSGSTMGTSYQILVAGFPDSVSDADLARGIDQRLYRIDRELMSTYAPDSELSRYNNSEPGEWFEVSAELAWVIDQALQISRLTDGYFDVTVGPLVDRWGFGPQQAEAAGVPRVPDDAEIAQLQTQIGYDALEVTLQPPALRKSRQVRVDLSGIAKGYGADVIADYMAEVGQESYFIEIGGELRIRGIKPDGSAWVPAIEKPTAGAPEIHRIFYTHGQSIGVAGSGDYRNYFEQNGQRYSHEIDPFTGRPVTHSLAAVYVIADNATVADALATAFMVMGEPRSMALAEQIGLAAYFIVKSTHANGFEQHYSSRFADYLEETP